METVPGGATMCTAGDGLWSTRPDCGAARGVIFISDRGFVVLDLDPGFFWFLGVIVVVFLVSETSAPSSMHQ